MLVNVSCYSNACVSAQAAPLTVSPTDGLWRQLGGPWTEWDHEGTDPAAHEVSRIPVLGLQHEYRPNHVAVLPWVQHLTRALRNANG